MKIVIGSHRFQPQHLRPVLVIGTMDGVHLGHQSVLQKARKIADECAGTLVVMTFHPHPLRIVSESHAPSMLQTFGQRCATLQSQGVDTLWLLPFCKDLSDLSPRAFAQRYLQEQLEVRHVCVGRHFHFGQGRKGNISFLQRFGTEHGFTVEEVEEIRYRSLPVRSTGIRRLLSQGQVRLAAKLLGRAPSLIGRVVTGQRLGSRLGFPTANLDPLNEFLPKNGVYLTTMSCRGKFYPGVTNVGLRPTIPNSSISGPSIKVESHLLDFSGEIYGAFVELFFLARLRREKKFGSLDLLTHQIQRDCARARRYFQRVNAPFPPLDDHSSCNLSIKWERLMDFRKAAGWVGWLLTAIAGTVSLSTIAFLRQERINSLWIVTAAVCTFLLAYRFYGKFLAARVMALDDSRATPAERFRNGHDFEPTHKWILFGHHFAAIAGPGPLVGPVLAAQFGYLPGTLWIIIGAVLAGAVQDFLILFASLRRDGKSLAQIAREEIGPTGGIIALLTVLCIMVILLGVVALVVVNALKGSPWGTFTIAATMPIAVLMGLYLRYWRPGKVLECSAVGFGLVVLSIFGGQWIAQSSWAPLFTLSSLTLALLVILYGFWASALPVWLLLAPRDYLSTFVKLGVVFLLGIGVFLVRPDLELPAITRFVDGNGPIFSGKIFPFCFITIACGAISGFHSLISSGTTPKMIAREGHALPVGYGAMLLEGFVAIMAMVAACSLEPGVYFAVNSPAGIVGTAPEAASAVISSWGFPVTAGQMQELAGNVGEQTLFARTGGAPSFALGMANIFARWGGGPSILGFWYHFAIMFEALFILTIIDAGTRVGRFMVQDLLGHIKPSWGATGWMPGIYLTSFFMVSAWGYFLYQGVIDPLGGINSLWPLFGIANQLLAAIALCVATTILLRMYRWRFAWISFTPLFWLVVVTYTGGIQKIFSANPRIGFLSQAGDLQSQLSKVGLSAGDASRLQTLIFNARMDAVVCSLLLILVSVILIQSMWKWIQILQQAEPVGVEESPYVPTRLAEEKL